MEAKLDKKSEGIELTPMEKAECKIMELEAQNKQLQEAIQKIHASLREARAIVLTFIKLAGVDPNA